MTTIIIDKYDLEKAYGRMVMRMSKKQMGNEQKMNDGIGLVRKYTSRDGIIRVEIVQQDGSKVSLSGKEIDELIDSLKAFFPEKYNRAL